MELTAAHHLTRNTKRGLALAVILVGAIGVILACLRGVGAPVGLLPFALLSLGVWAIYRDATRDDPDNTPTRSFREVR